MTEGDGTAPESRRGDGLERCRDGLRKELGVGCARMRVCRFLEVSLPRL